jgi:hypothetical protein
MLAKIFISYYKLVLQPYELTKNVIGQLAVKNKCFLVVL